MKKLISLMAALIILFTLTSCTKETAYPYKSGSDTVSCGVFSYYYHKVAASPRDYSAKKDDKESILAATELCCKEYLAAIRLMEKEGIVSGVDFKRLAAENTENQWGMFSSYYESIGVTKQDITRIELHESRLLQLLDHFYGAEGERPVEDMELKEEFVDMYVGFKAIEGSLTKENEKGETVSLTQEEEEAVREQFSRMAERINQGDGTIDEINTEYNDSQGIIVTLPLEILLMKDGDAMYDDDFFEAVSQISHGRAGTVVSGSSIYVIERATIATDDEDAFMLYRSEVLEHMRMPSVKKKLTSLIKKMDITKDEECILEIIK